MRALLASFIIVTASQVFASGLIVKFKNDHKPSELKSPHIIGVRVLIRDLNLYLVRYNSIVDLDKELNDLREYQSIQYVQKNHILKKRGTTPNDPYFSRQWSLNSVATGNVQAQQTWDITTGGFDRNGNSIVVAVLDGGFDIGHADIKDSLWINKGEIAGNGIDDDKNGFVDDVNGIDAATRTGKLNLEDHGTHVASIIGAKGNDGVGLTGLNWSARLMFISTTALSTAEIVEGYGYIMTQKKLWISSKGKSGANVVVTNMSMGLDGEKCTDLDYPVWNDVYNQLGSNGILSVISVPNMNWDIDVKGDVPSACSSDFIISATNSDEKGNMSKETNQWTGKSAAIAARGVVNVDLAAPGTNIWGAVPHVCDDFGWSCDKTKKYVSWTGTSFSSPHVTGTVALMFSAASNDLLADYARDPEAGALMFKELLLSSVDKTAEFSTLVLTGGRLNTLRSIEAAAAY